MIRTAIAASLIATTISAAPSSAAVVSPVAVSASNTFSFFGDYKPVNLIDRSGLSNGLHDGAYTNMWMTDLGVQSAVLHFDLGRSRELTGISIWNYNADFGMGYSLVRGAREFTVSLSGDGTNYVAALAGTLLMGTGQPLAAQSFTLDGNARYVRLDLLGNYGDIYSSVGLSEVNFASVPEPATAGLVAIAAVLVGASRRRRVADAS